MSNSIKETYQLKEEKQHILDAPDTYIGSIEEDVLRGWVLNEDKFKYKKYKCISGFCKLFDETIVNARDHYIRTRGKIENGEKDILPVTKIEVNVDKETGVISILNNGNGIDVQKHPEHGIWVPELIFGHLRTSTNYNKKQKKIVGGKNGFGIKLVFIYSKWGTIETVDHLKGLKYTQTFSDNLYNIGKPSVRKCKTKPYTKLTFLPDYERFGKKGLDDEMFQLLKKRTFDIGAVTDKSVNVKFNNEKVPFKCFERYIDMYLGPRGDTKRLYDCVNNRWEYAISMSPTDEFTQVSFVNGICTNKGGKHVDYILGQVVRKLGAYIEKKKNVKVKPASIKEQLMLFVNCVIENPSFESQTKDYLNTPFSKFGSRCEVSDNIIEKLAKMGIMSNALASNELKQKNNSKQTDGKKTKSIRGIPKLMDANYAGTKKSDKCTLILCEGDSAKAGILSGLSKDDRKYFGVFPLKGKGLNTRYQTQSKINSNPEISNLKKIVGLTSSTKYTKDLVNKTLRYGRILFMTDQDLDGSHIKGLCINLFHDNWKELLSIDGFIGFMNTPIIKATKGKKSIPFYNEKQYNDWKNCNDGKWNIKYYKGLGTSSAKEFKEYFKNKKVVHFKHYGEDCSNSINKAFDKKLANERKQWLEEYNRDIVLDTNQMIISFKDFINKELIHFSIYDCERNIPSCIDGLKISIRKILYSSFKKGLKKEIKVAQLSGYVSENSGYHHGEESLQGGIIGMAQEYVGSNNISLLTPIGQFGTRLLGGKDHASARYIYTMLNDITFKIFPTLDFPVLSYKEDDGHIVEPEYYTPIIPFALINPCVGIGTGFSHTGLSFNPLELSSYIKRRLKDRSCMIGDILPYYEGFEGTISKLSKGKYIAEGIFEIIDKTTIKINELPIGNWTSPYKDHLLYLMSDKNKKNEKKKPSIKSFEGNCTTEHIEFIVKFNDSIPKNFKTLLKLTSTLSLNNMNMFSVKNNLKKFGTVQDVIDEYFPIRYKMYQKRKDYMLRNYEKDIILLSNKARFIKEQCDDTIDLRKRTKENVIKLLKDREYDIIEDNGVVDLEYGYLRGMTIAQVEIENMDKLNNKLNIVKESKKVLENTSIEQMWNKEIEDFEDSYHKYIKLRYKRISGK